MFVDPMIERSEEDGREKGGRLMGGDAEADDGVGYVYNAGNKGMRSRLYAHRMMLSKTLMRDG
jgi:hypothetical protein